MEKERRAESWEWQSSYGCVLGACCGDAAGAPLEHVGRKPTMKEVCEVMEMKKSLMTVTNLCYNLLPSIQKTQFKRPTRTDVGQITDDGEMTLCCLRGLCDFIQDHQQNKQKVKQDFDVEYIAKRYAEWVVSPAFDMGVTIGASIGCVLMGMKNEHFEERIKQEGYAKCMKSAALYDTKSSRGEGSCSNGSLMRATPLGLFGYFWLNGDVQKIEALCSEDGALSHPNNTCTLCVVCYTLAICHLIGHKNDRKGAFQVANQYIEDKITTTTLQEKDGASMLKNAQTVRGWLANAKNNKGCEYYPASGWIRIGFIHAFRLLLLDVSYEEAIREVLSGGGDTDTNAAIVGGLIGAAVGEEGIPSTLTEAVLSCDTKGGDHPRPDWLILGKCLTPLLQLMITTPDREEEKQEKSQ